MQIKIGQAVGLNTDQQAALVLADATNQDTFLAVLKLSCDDAFTKGRQVLSELEDLYHESEGTIAQKLQDIFAQAEEKLKEVESFSLLLGLISGKVLYFLKAGEVEVYLKRANKLSSLSDLAQPKQLVSGFLMEGDRAFLATKSLTEFLGDDLEKTLQLALSEWEEETNSKIAAVNQDVQGLSGMLIDVEGEQAQVPLNMASVQEEETGKEVGGLGSLISKLKKSNEEAVEQDSYQQSSGRKINLNLGKFIPKTRKGRLIVGVILLMVILSGVGIQYKKAQDSQKEAQFNQYLQTAKDGYVAAQNLSSLNPTETKNKLTEAKDSVIAALTLKPTNSEALDLKKQIEENTDKLLQQFSASMPDFLDLNLVKNGFRASWMSLSGTNLLLLDPSSKTLVTVDTAKKSQKSLAGADQLGVAAFAALNGNYAFVYSTDKGVIRVDSTNNKVTTVAKLDKDLTGVVDIAGFASNVYLLDKTSSKIWKYLATADGYSDKKEYLNPGVKGDFADAKRMQIESSIYALKANGTILRYTRGATDSFSLTGLDKPLKDPKSFFTSSDVENVYILDSGNSRVVVVDKKGVYKAQYQADKLLAASDLVADEKNKKIYILDGSKIYSMDLK